jgi:hypothetical protein
VPQGDLAALEAVMAHASSFWNGVNSLIVPVDRLGRVPSAINYFLQVRGIEQLFAHEAIADSLLPTLSARFGQVSRMWEGFDERELHPIHLCGAHPAVRHGMAEPELSTGARMQRVKLACWGDIADVDRAHWERALGLRTRTIAGSHLGGLLSAQTSGRTPLLVSGRYMRAFAQQRPTWERYLWVFGRLSFNELVEFWNCRARLTGWDGEPHMVGAPREILRDPELLRPLLDWVAPRGGTWVKPDIIVCAQRQDAPAVKAAFKALGFRQYTGATISHGFPTPNPDRPDPEFQIHRPVLGGPMKRGTPAWTLATFTGDDVSLVLPVPEDFEVSASRLVRIELHNLPLPLPANDRLAQELLHAARVTLDGIGFAVDADRRSWNFDIGLPSGWEALRLWYEGFGFQVERSQAGRYGEALLGRLGELERLEVLASEPALAVLDQLAPLSAKKLAQHLAAAAGPSELDEQRIAEALRAEPLWMELQTRTLGDIASGVSRRKKDLLPALAALSEAGFIRRGRALRCPACNYPDWLALPELDEYVRCRACGHRHALPVTDPGKAREADVHYRLDGLMARCMDQDLLPVLLALRCFHRLRPTVQIEQAWPGLLLTRGEHEREVDLLASAGQRVSIFECKATAASLRPDEAQELVETATSLRAVPTVAALRGEFDDRVRAIVAAADGICLERRHLLADDPRVAADQP